MVKVEKLPTQTIKIGTKASDTELIERVNEFIKKNPLVKIDGYEIYITETIIFMIQQEEELF